MGFTKLQLTDAGRGVIVKALAGGSINFTKMQIGNGEEPDDIESLTVLQNPLKDVTITNIETGEGAAMLTGQFDNAELTSGFEWTELGVYADDEDLGEVLYAYGYAGDGADYVPAYSGSSYLNTTINIAVAVGDATSVTATVGEYIGYTSSEDFENHVNDTSNPHKVTKSQIGLGNVQNYAFNNAPITYTSLSALTTTSSGETISTVFAKVKIAISNLKTHLSASNPHSITCSKIGAAASSHNHSATDITSGTLGIARGGTGSATAVGAANSILGSGATAIGGDLEFSNPGETGDRGLVGNMAEDDKWHIKGRGAASDAGYLEIATSNDGTEAIVCRQYNDADAGTDSFTTIQRSAYILNASGNTVFPGSCTATSHPTSSDLKLKDVSGELDEDTANQIIMGLKPICYKFKGDTRNNMGLGAQDVYKLLKSVGISESAVYKVNEIGRENEGDVLADSDIDATDDEKLNWTIDYQQLIAPLIKVVQQQQEKIEALEKRMEVLENGLS